jgi:hypothetical protein
MKAIFKVSKVISNNILSNSKRYFPNLKNNISSFNIKIKQSSEFRNFNFTIVNFAKISHIGIGGMIRTSAKK